MEPTMQPQIIVHGDYVLEKHVGSIINVASGGIVYNYGNKPKNQKGQSAEEPSTHTINKDELSTYFKAPFRGMGGNPNYFDMLTAELEKPYSDAELCQIAVLIYQSHVLNNRRPNTFKEWYRQFCNLVGCQYEEIRKPI